MSRAYFECFKAFLVLIAIFYLPGLFFYPFFAEAYYNYYQYSGGLYTNAVVLLSVFIASTFFCFYMLDKIPILKLPHLNSNFVRLLILLIIFLFFLLSVNFSVNFTSSFRHKNRLSNSALVAFMFFLKPIIFYIVSLILIYILNGWVLGNKSRVMLKVILLSCFLSLNSSLQFIVIPFILIMLYFPNVLTKSLRDFNVITVLMILFLLIFICAIVVFIGVGNKVGYSYLLSPDGVDYLMNYGNRLFPRLSSSIFSSVITLNYYIDGVNYTWEVLSGFYETFINRISLIFSIQSFDPSLIKTVDRLNYLEVFQHHAPRAGASPGLIASSFYTPFFPLGFLAIPLYVAIIFRSVNNHMMPSIKFNIFSYLFLVYFLMNLFESPLNIFYLLDPMFILFFTVVVLGKFINIEKVFSK